MRKIDVCAADRLDWREKVETLVGKEGETQFPVQVTLHHVHKPGVVIPLIEVYEDMPAGIDLTIPLRSYVHAWNLVGQLAHIAFVFGLEKIATVSCGDPATAQSQPPAVADEQKPAGKKAAKESAEVTQ